MNANSSKPWILATAFLISLTACGGGGKDAGGSPVAFSLTPTSVSWTFVTGGGTTCQGDPVGTPGGFPGVATVLINGGAGNYQVATTTSDLVITSQPTRVNGVYQFQFTKDSSSTTCFPDGVILQVTDEKHNIATVNVVAKAASS